MDRGEIITVVIAGIAFIGLLQRIFWNYIKPLLMPRPDIKYMADHYFVSNTEAAHDIVVFNAGKGTAHDIDYYMMLKSPFKILNSTSTPLGDKETNGKGSASYHSLWKTLPPQNFITTRILSEADKNNPNTVFPLETKLSDKKGILSRMYTP